MLPQVNIIRAKNGDFLSFFERAGIAGVLTAHGVWDEATIGLAKVLVDQCGKVPLVLDIGANMGTFTIPLAKHVAQRSGVVHAFEPQRIVNYQLGGNIFLNRIDNAHVHRLALSDVSGDREIEELDYHKAWNIGAFSIVPGQDRQEKVAQKTPVQFLRLDDLPLQGAITLIKLDVEGMELDVLCGGVNRLNQDGFPPILFESLKNDSKASLVVKLLTGLGYTLSQYADEDWLAQHPAWDSEIALNIDQGAMSMRRVR